VRSIKRRVAVAAPIAAEFRPRQQLIHTDSMPLLRLTGEGVGLLSWWQPRPRPAVPIADAAARL